MAVAIPALPEAVAQVFLVAFGLSYAAYWLWRIWADHKEKGRSA